MKKTITSDVKLTINNTSLSQLRSCLEKTVKNLCVTFEVRGTFSPEL